MRINFNHLPFFKATTGFNYKEICQKRPKPSIQCHSCLLSHCMLSWFAILKKNHLSCQVLFGCVMFRPICYCHVMVRVRSGGAMSMSDKSPFSSSLQSFFLVTIYLYGWMDYSDHTHNGVALHLSMGRSFAENYTGSLSIRLLFQRLIF